MKTIITIGVSIMIAIATMASATSKQRITKHYYLDGEYVTEMEFNSRTNWD